MKVIIIVGCGLAGLSAALALVRKNENVRIIVLEKRPDFDRRGATFGLAPSGQVALQEISPTIVESLKEIGIFMAFSGGYMLPWWGVRDTLLDEAKKEERIEIRLGVTAQTVSDTTEGDLVTVTLSDETVLEASLLIGADGVHSSVRSQVLHLPPAKPTGAFVWRGSINTETIPELHHLTENSIGSFQKFGDRVGLALFNFHARIPGTIAWVLTCRDDTVVPGTTTAVDLIRDFLSCDDEKGEQARTAKLIFENSPSEELQWCTEMSVVDLEESGWGGKGRITLIGDAAHALRPASGMGGSMAFEDAALLARALETSLEEGGEPGALRKFESQRLPRVKSISKDQTLRSELSYKHPVHLIPPWDPKYKEWVDLGLEAPPDPPCDPQDALQDLMGLLQEEKAV